MTHPQTVGGLTKNIAKAQQNQKTFGHRKTKTKFRLNSQRHTKTKCS